MVRTIGIAVVAWCIASVPAAIACGAVLRWANRSHDEAVQAAARAAAARRAAARGEAAAAAAPNPVDRRTAHARIDIVGNPSA
jgi:hypothetical protein